MQKPQLSAHIRDIMVFMERHLPWDTNLGGGRALALRYQPNEGVPGQGVWQVGDLV